MTEEDDGPEIIRDAAVASIDDLVTNHNIDELVESVKHSRLAVGAIDGMEIRTEVYCEVDGDDIEWYIETSATRPVEKKKHVRHDEGIVSKTIGKTLRTEYESAGQAYLEFNKLVEQYNLEEVTDPEGKI